MGWRFARPRLCWFGGPAVLLAAVLAGWQTATYVPPSPYYEVLMNDLDWNEPIDSPSQWFADNFSRTPDSSPEFVEVTLVDFDGDGVDEWVLSCPGIDGGRNRYYGIFTRKANAFWYAGWAYGSEPAADLRGDGQGCLYNAGMLGGGEWIEYWARLENGKLVWLESTHWTQGPDGEPVAIQD